MKKYELAVPATFEAQELRELERRTDARLDRVKAAEQRAAALGCGQLELSSSLKREGAHRFYLAQGYCERPKRFVKAV